MNVSPDSEVPMPVKFFISTALIVDVLRSTFFKIYFLVFPKLNFKNLSEIKLQNIITIVIFNKCVKQDEIHTKRRFL